MACIKFKNLVYEEAFSKTSDFNQVDPYCLINEDRTGEERLHPAQTFWSLSGGGFPYIFAICEPTYNYQPMFGLSKYSVINEDILYSLNFSGFDRWIHRVSPAELKRVRGEVGWIQIPGLKRTKCPWVCAVKPRSRVSFDVDGIKLERFYGKGTSVIVYALDTTTIFVIDSQGKKLTNVGQPFDIQFRSLTEHVYAQVCVQKGDDWPNDQGVSDLLSKMIWTKIHKKDMMAFAKLLGNLLVGYSKPKHIHRELIHSTEMALN
jgi:hypothetical protein